MFNSLLSIGLIASTALAQSVSIGLPKAGTVLSPGLDYTFQIQEADSLTNVQEVALVIGLQECQHGDCFPVDETLGTVLYTGAFAPQFHEPGLPPYQNFTVTIPENTSTKSCLVGVAHFALVGDGMAPQVDYQNQSVTVA